MTVHLFENGPSPAIAIFGLRKTADDSLWTMCRPPAAQKMAVLKVAVMQAIPAADRAKSIKDLDLHHDVLLAQRSLWDPLGH